jgi:hypothetical protein
MRIGGKSNGEILASTSQHFPVLIAGLLFLADSLLSSQLPSLLAS